MRYQPHLPRALKGITLTTKAGEKVGIVGRTGAGKSSLSLALFRILEPHTGSIVIDGQDIRSVGLQCLRSRLTIIPQEPTLFSGSLRFNLDPGGRYSEERLYQAVGVAGLGELVHSLQGGLDHPLSEGGAGLSGGGGDISVH